MPDPRTELTDEEAIAMGAAVSAFVASPAYAAFELFMARHEVSIGLQAMEDDRLDKPNGLAYYRGRRDELGLLRQAMADAVVLGDRLSKKYAPKRAADDGEVDDGRLASVLYSEKE